MTTVNLQRASDITLEEAANNVAVMGHDTTIIFEASMGIGKSSMANEISKQLPEHKLFYFDCTTKMDSGDVVIPVLKDMQGGDFVRFATNEELGIHLRDTKCIVMLDEIGKGNLSLINSLMRFMLEGKLGSYTKHPESITFGTTNLSAENVGDKFLPHHRNRVTIQRIRKPTNEQWIEWAFHNGVQPLVMAWAADNPQAFQDFDEVHNPDDNEFIYHPKAAGRTSFVTGRSLNTASKWVARRDKMTERSLRSGLIGSIGAPAAQSMMSYLKFNDQLPTLDSIKQSPQTAKVPTTTAAVCLLVFRTLASIERVWIPQWMEYMDRLPREAQALFGMQATKPNYVHRNLMMCTPAFMDWCRVNSHLVTNDK